MANLISSGKNTQIDIGDDDGKHDHAKKCHYAVLPGNVGLKVFKSESD